VLLSRYLKPLSRAFAMATLVGVVAFAGAQQTTIRPLKRTIGPRAVTDSTYSVFPQIDERIRLAPGRPENPTPQWWRKPDEGRNTLPVGGLLQETRGSVTAHFPGIGFTGWIPPDPNEAVGPGHIVQVVNTSIAFFTKTGTKLFEQGMAGGSGFFGAVGAGGFVFDPKAFYDAISQRFFVIALEQDDGSATSKLLIAVSDDSNPSGNWFKYRIEAKQNIGGADTWLDYPGWAGNKDAIVCTGNQFTFGTNQFRGGSVTVMTKAPMLSGGAPTISYFIDNGFTIQPGRTWDSTSDRIYGATELNNNSLKLYAITNLTSSPVITTRSLAVPTYSPSPGVAPSTGGNVLDTLPFRIMNAYYRAGKFVCTHSVARVAGGPDTMVRWYEIAMNNWPTAGNPSLVQSGNVQAPNGQNYFMPAVNTNVLGDISLIFTRSSASITADVMYAGRKATDPPGSMGQPQLLASSTGNYAQYRWGDYFDVSIDPLDDTRFWGTAMIAQGGVWLSTIHTWLISTPGGGGGGGGTAIDPTSIVMIQGAGSSGDVTSVKLSDDVYFNVLSTSEAGLGQIGAAQLSFTIPSGTINTLRAKVEAVGVTGSTGMVWLYNFNTGQFDHIKSFPVRGSGNSATSVNLDTKSQYMSSSREVRMAIRGLVPERRGSMPPTFTLRLDQVQLIMN
jgi:hypothetical protein